MRVTANGAKSYVFEKKLDRQTVRRTIGDVSDWSIEVARVEARRLSVMLDVGVDPRQVDRDKQAAAVERKATAAAQIEAAKVAALTVGEVWQDYIEKRRQFGVMLTYKTTSTKSKTRRRGAQETRRQRANYCPAPSRIDAACIERPRPAQTP